MIDGTEIPPWVIVTGFSAFAWVFGWLCCSLWEWRRGVKSLAKYERENYGLSNPTTSIKTRNQWPAVKNDSWDGD